jgi:hypothetical protein
MTGEHLQKRTDCSEMPRLEIDSDLSATFVTFQPPILFHRLAEELLMILRTLSTFLVLFLPFVQATAVTIAISSNEQQCYYADVDKAREKLGVSVVELFLDK